MKHINSKIARLLHEGVSISTLEKMSNGQLNLLYNKVVKEQAVPPNEKKTVTATQTTVPPGGNATVPAGSKIENKGGKTVITTTSETELGEEEKVGKKKEVKEKAMSKKQQQFFGIVRGMQKGDIPKKGRAGKVAKDIDPKDAKDFAKTKHKGLPIRKESDKDDVKKLEENIMRLVEKHLYPEVSKKDLLKLVNKR
jgi:hypothetical protein